MFLNLFHSGNEDFKSCMVLLTNSFKLKIGCSLSFQKHIQFALNILLRQSELKSIAVFALIIIETSPLLTSAVIRRLFLRTASSWAASFLKQLQASLDFAELVVLQGE
jgi:hypothetical protein